jgi:tetratricopeptide (TPR) repeat protein
MAALDASAGHAFLADPKVTILSQLAFALLHLGHVDQARARLAEAYERARIVGQPVARLVALWYDALIEIRLDNVPRVAELAGELSAIVDEFALAQGRGACLWFAAWAEARAGRPLEAHRKIREGYELNAALGMRAGATETLGYAAEALVMAGDLEGAERTLREAFTLAEEQGERIYLPQLILVEAAIARARADAALGAQSARRAVAEARNQQATWLELVALVDLCEHPGARAQDRAALATLLHGLPEAAGTPQGVRARKAVSGAASA